jgi:hypothetical protein
VRELPKKSLPLLRIELDDELFLDRRVDLAALGLLEHLAGESVVVASLITCCAAELGGTVMMSLGRTWKLGMLTRRPLTWKCPCRTS